MTAELIADGYFHGRRLIGHRSRMAHRCIECGVEIAQNVVSYHVAGGCRPTRAWCPACAEDVPCEKVPLADGNSQVRYARVYEGR